MDERLQNYVESLSKMINIETISNKMDFDKKVFDDFHSLLRKLFPHIFNSFKYEEFNGSILLSYLVDNDLDPVLFMSHHDVVSENGTWKHDAFKATLEEGKLYGRGTLDTKGNLFCILQSIEELLIEGYKFNRSIYIESSCNEETTNAGAYEISRELLKRNVRFYFTMDEGGMIVHDPFGGANGTYAMVALGEKNCIDLKFTARSNGGHSSTPDKNNPLTRLSRFIIEVEDHKIVKPRLDDITLETFRKLSLTMKGPLKFLFKHSRFFKHLLCKIMAKVSPLSASMVKSTICFTKAKGSDEFNVIPVEAYVTGNIRANQFDRKEDMLKKLEKIAKKYNIEIDELDPGYYSKNCDYKTEQFKFLSNMIEKNFEGVITAPYISTGASDSKYFNDLSDNVFRFAPIIATNEQLDTIHAREENISIDSLIKAVDFYKNLIKEL